MDKIRYAAVGNCGLSTGASFVPTGVDRHGPGPRFELRFFAFLAKATGQELYTL